jgi:hypothetical protein
LKPAVKVQEPEHGLHGSTKEVDPILPLLLPLLLPPQGVEIVCPSVVGGDAGSGQSQSGTLGQSVVLNQRSVTWLPQFGSQE